MGPGYFPLVLGILLAAIGAFIIFESLVVETEDGEPIGKFAWKPLVFIIGANVVFGILLGGLPQHRASRPLGLIVAHLRAGLHRQPWRATSSSSKEVLVLATILAVGSYLAFIVLLKLQFPVWPTFITG